MGRFDEPLLMERMDRFCLFPIQDDDIYRMYAKAEASFWTVNEVDLGSDLADFERLTDHERRFILRVLAFFASADGIVNENLACRFLGEVQLQEARLFYGFQIAIEGIHNQMYSELINFYERDPEAQKTLFNAIDDIPAIRTKAVWAMKWMDETCPFEERLIAFMCVEGIFFSASFCAIFWLKKRGIMPGLTFSNELISRDEALHCEFACLLYSRLKNRVTVERVHEIVDSAVSAECEFVEDALDVDIIGINARLMSQYVRYVADHWLRALDVPALYNVSNPFDWMELISLQGKTNFFEKRVGDYQLAASCGSDRAFSINEDF